jgi:hypothetical protein
LIDDKNFYFKMVDNNLIKQKIDVDDDDDDDDIFNGHLNHQYDEN